MGKRKNKKEDVPLEKNRFIREETSAWVFAILFFVVFIFFMLASLDMAGFVGKKTFEIFYLLFGWGYFLLPILCVMLSVSFIRSIKQSFSATKTIGSLLFFISSLGLLDTVLNSRGGFVGKILHEPIVGLFDVYASVVIFIALILVSILIIFDTPINISSILGIFRKKEEFGKDDIEINGLAENPKEKDLVKKVPAPKIEPVSSDSTKRQDGGDEFTFKKSMLSSKPFTPPPLSLLERDKGKPEVGDIKANANIIKRTLLNFGIVVEMDEISIGPSVTRYALKPAEGVKLSKILGLQNNLELALAAHPVRIEAPIPGKSLVGIEIPNTVKTTVGLASVLSQSEYTDSDKPLLISLGKGISGNSQFADLAKMPHLLIAGATGSGKSVTIHVIINSILFRNSPENLKFVMIDPKRVELTLYNKIPHLLTPVITDAKKAIIALKWAAKEMDRRYNILEENKVRDIGSYHKNILAPTLERIRKEKKTDEASPELMPYMVIIIDELADIMQAYPRELESAIVRLAQMSRAVGIHLILSTQRPSVNVITGLIKANIPARIALQVSSQIDSRTILDSSGAEKLLGAGDMLYLSGEMSKPIRLQSPFISETEVKKVAEYLVKSREDDIPEEINFDKEGTNKDAIFESGNLKDDGDIDDDMYEEARETVISTGKASTSYLQRKLRIGYARAARLVDILEEKGVIGKGDGAKPREVLIKPEGNYENNREQDDEPQEY
jgi:S-DNA-T family DNA segregation ATPase FtsK/SpoIIIE